MSEEQLFELVTTLKRLGFTHVHWEKTSQGPRAEGPGKFQVPSHNTAHHVCHIHGNPVRVARETYPARNKGVRILTVHPCPFCAPGQSICQAARYSESVLHPVAS